MADRNTSRITTRNTSTCVNVETGEILSHSEETSKVVGREPDFVKLYLRDIVYMADMPQSYTGIIGQLMRYCSPAEPVIKDKDGQIDPLSGGMIIYLNSTIKKRICDELGMTKKNSIVQLNNAITKLVKGSILIRIARGAFRPNPCLFGRGRWSDIEELRLQVTYDVHGRTFATVVKEKEENEEQELTAEEAKKIDRAEIVNPQEPKKIA